MKRILTFIKSPYTWILVWSLTLIHPMMREVQVLSSRILFKINPGMTVVKGMQKGCVVMPVPHVTIKGKNIFKGSGKNKKPGKKIWRLISISV